MRESATPSDLATQDLKKWMRYAIAGVGLSIAGSLLAVKIHNESLDFTAMSQFPLWGLLALFVMVSLAWICNGLRTWVISRVVGHAIPVWKAIGITLSMEFAIAATPAGVGGMITRMGLQKRQGMSFEKTTSLMSADWIADLLFFMVLAPFGLWQLIEQLPWSQIQRSDHPEFRGWAGVVIIALLVIISSFLWQRKRIMQILPRSLRLYLGGLTIRLKNTARKHIVEIRETFALILSNHRMDYLAVIGLATIQWSCRYGVLWVILKLLGADINPIVIMLIQGSLFMLGLLIVVPGGGGSVELLTSILLAPMVGAPIATTAVVIWRFFTYYAYLISGGVAFAFNTRIWLFSNRETLGASAVDSKNVSSSGSNY